MSTQKKPIAKPAAVERAATKEGFVPGLRVVARPAVFRRAGYEFSGEARDLPLSELTDEQIVLLRNEKALVVMDCDIPVMAEAVAE
jgi:hypothetical protein